MDIVIDANILFAALIRDGRTAELIFNDRLRLFAPERLFEEFERYEGHILERTDRSPSDFMRLVSILRKRITVKGRATYKGSMPRARRVCPDPDDVEYFALAIELEARIWSNDKRLKGQDTVTVLDTGELIEILSKGRSRAKDKG